MVHIRLLEISQELETKTSTWALRLYSRQNSKPSAAIMLAFRSIKTDRSSSYLLTTGLMKTAALGRATNQFLFSITKRPWIVSNFYLWLSIKEKLKDLCLKTYLLISQWWRIIPAILTINMIPVLWILTQSGVYSSCVVYQVATMDLGLKLATLIKVTHRSFKLLSHRATTTFTSIVMV